LGGHRHLLSAGGEPRVTVAEDVYMVLVTHKVGAEAKSDDFFKLWILV
jgi:hypothetical protein